MKTYVRKLSTGDVLVYDSKGKNAYILQPDVNLDLMCEEHDLMQQAGNLVACGLGVSLTHSILNQLNMKTANIEFLS